MKAKTFINLLQDDETQLRVFTECYSKYTNIKEISKQDLKHWVKLTERTEGKYISKYMSPKRWGDSTESLKAALAILINYAPKSLVKRDGLQDAITKLRLQILKNLKPQKKILT